MYYLYKVIKSFSAKGIRSISQYWSRFCFRLSMLIHTLLAISSCIVENTDPVKQEKLFNTLLFMYQTVFLISIVFLSKSFLDFSVHIGRQQFWIREKFYWISVPLFIFAETCLTLHLLGGQGHDFLLYFMFFAFALLCIMTLAPGSVCLYEIYQYDLSSSYSCRIRGFFIFFIIIIIFTIITFGARYMVGVYGRQNLRLTRFSVFCNGFLDLLITFAQDILDSVMDRVVPEDNNMQDDSIDELRSPIE